MIRGTGIRLAAAGLLGLLAGSGAGAAEMYKWVDEHGVTQYTQHPPPGDIKAETVAPPPPPPSNPDDDGARRAGELAEEWRSAREEAAKERAAAAEERAMDEEDCRRARQSVQAYSVPNALVLQPDGSRTRLTEEERLAGLAEAEERVKQFCGNQR